MGPTRRVGLLLSALCVAVLTACTNTPPPPVVTSPSAEPSPPPTKTPSQIVVGIDAIAGGYNPHNLADASTLTSALSQLLLPSVFRPTSEGDMQLDKNLMTSAAVVTEEPFTVAYEIRPDASWSDGAPIAVEDFSYLAEAMRDEPGTVDPAGYRLISDIRPGEGGKRVEVVFSTPYPGWQTLFSGLLPAHLLKDAPGGWQGALEASFPVYGGPFSIKTLDQDRGEIILERNERYWDKPAAVDQLVFRRADAQGLTAALRSGNDQFAIARTDADDVALLGELGDGFETHTLARPEVATVLLRPTGAALADDRVRAGVAALIDRDKLIAEGTGGGPSAGLRADAQVLAPSLPDYAPTIPQGGSPAVPDPGKAEELLTDAGYSKESGTWRKDGEPLSLVLAAPGDKEPYATILQELTNQLVAAGIDARAVNPPPRELYANQLETAPQDGSATTAPDPDNAGAVGVDIAVVPRAVGGDPASVLAASFGCLPQREEPAVQPAPRLPANTGAFCAEELQPAMDEALAGTKPVPEALAELEPELWRSNVSIPLFQRADTMVIGPGVSGVGPGPELAGPFGSAVNWTRGSK